MAKVIIVDDQNSIREFLKINLSTEADINVVGMADNGQAAIAQVGEHQPDIVLMDIEMPGNIDGIEATKAIAQRFPKTKVLLFTSQDNREQLNRALMAGARGYILKNTSIKDVGNIIRLTEQGFFQIGPILGNWEGSNVDRSSTSSTNIYTESVPSQVGIMVGHPQYSYADEAVGNGDRRNRLESNLTSGVFPLQETINSQEDTIVNLTDKYSQVQQQIETKLNNRSNVYRKKRSLGYNNIARSRPISLGKQHFLFISSFFLGVFTVMILMLMIKFLGGS